MIEYECWLFCYDMVMGRIFCCHCFLDHVHFLIREEEKNFTEIIEKIIQNKKYSFFFYFLGGTLFLSCSFIIKFIRESKNVRLLRDSCVTDVIWCKDQRLTLCTACAIDLFRKNDILHCFKLKE